MIIKKIVSLTIALLMMVMTPLAVFADAEDIVKPINVSLAEAEEKMMNSVQGQLLELGKMGDKAAISTASEGLKSLNETQELIRQMYQEASQVNAVSAVAIRETANAIKLSIGGTSETNVERNVVYAKSILEPNDKARHNALKLQSIEMYYSLKAAEESLATVKESYGIAQTTYDQTKKKYTLGTVSKVDLLNAELDLAEAKDKLTATENSVKNARMGFNILFGYDLMQPVNLTDNIEVPSLPAITVEEAIAAALNNRNEMREAKYAEKTAELDFVKSSSYPAHSATYLQGKAKYLGVVASCELVPITIEQDVRAQYDAINQFYDALQTSKKNVSNAKETLRLTQLQYNSGLVTYNTVQQVRMLYESALLGESSAKLNYALAVEKFNMSIDVGVKTAGF